ncbi:MAG: hypothetical protein VB027_04270 [Gordonibacter sp.]|nr:hypothetical protein [Gordonibacter sp.]
MLHDMRLLFWLRARHLRTKTLSMLHILGSDFQHDRSWSERAYQFYAIIVVVACLGLLWAALIDAATAFFSTAGLPVVEALFFAGFLAPIALFVALGFGALRSSIIKLSRPDIAFVAASALEMRAILVVALAFDGVMVGAMAGLAGYLVGMCLGVGLGVVVNVLLTAFLGALLAIAALDAAWLVGLVRLILEQTRRRLVVLVVLAATVLLVASICCGLVLFVNPSAVLADGVYCLCGVVAVMSIGELVALVMLAPRLDVTAVIKQNALYAELQPFGMLSPLDPALVRDYRRRVKLAGRRPLFHLLTTTGRGAVVMRAALSTVRQYEGIPSLLMQGATAAPLGLLALSGTGGVVVFLFWLVLLVQFPQGARTGTQAFRDDTRVRLIRDRLPFGVLELLILDSLPAFLLVNMVSIIAVVFMPLPGISLLAALVLVVLINAGIFLSCGLDAIRLFPGGPRPCYEMGAFALVAVVAACSFLLSPWFVAIGIAIMGAVVASVVHGGVECAH